MKKLLWLFLFIFLGLAFAQSVLEVPAEDESGNVITNALIKYVVADTSNDGKQLHDIYKLQRGKTYFYTQTPVFKNPITLIADEPGTTDETKPPKILLALDDAGEAPEAPCISTFADLTIKNIAFSTTTVEEAYSWANVIVLQSDGLTIDLEGCIFELSGWGMIEASVYNTVFKLNKCHVRNGTVLGSGDEWCPFFMEVNTGTADSVIIRNSTFFNLQGSVMNIEAQNYVGYFEFDHNTLVNVVKGFTTNLDAHLNTKITNNIFYNVNCHSATLEEVATTSDKIYVGVVSVDTLASNTPGSSLPFVMDEKDRKLTVANNIYFFSQGVKDYWAHYGDLLAKVEWMDSRAQGMFADKTTWPNLVEENNVNVDPGFTNFGGTDDMVAQMYNQRDNGTFGFWGWDPDSALYPDVHWAFLQWPLPEDFTYSASVMGSDGYHVGSLVYYPSELAKYENSLVSVDDQDNKIVPAKFDLQQNYPNPFNPSTAISFSVPVDGKYALKVFNTLGQEVAVLANGELTAGYHNVTFNPGNLSSGVYIYRLTGNNVNLCKKMVFMK